MDEAAAPEAGLTIDQLSEATGVTVRNIRAYQARGLLPAPRVVARTGYYDADHQARLALITDLTAEGVKLETVKRLLETTGGQSEQVVRFVRSVRHLFGDEERAIATRAELEERFGTTEEKLLTHVLAQGWLRPVGEDQFEEVSPRLVQAAQSLVGLGVPLARSLEVAAQLKRHVDGIARLYVDLFLDEIWKPFDASGRPEAGWARLHETIGPLRDVAGTVLFSLLEIAVSERLDVTFGKDIARTVRTGPAAD